MTMLVILPLQNLGLPKGFDPDTYQNVAKRKARHWRTYLTAQI